MREIYRLLSHNISHTTEEGALVRNGEPGPGREQLHDELPNTSGVDDDPLRDHHIEEMLSTFRDATVRRGGVPGAGEQRLD